MPNGELIYKPMSKSKLVAMKYNEICLSRVYDRINLFINMKSVSKLNLIKCILKRIDISKELMVNQI